eukprot:TRINITY_DN7660_c0_g2_i3.p1 TRINITY_DN7660_c0_g2~~TRINITY_DN7660_c0_g2_i3.p1  ORF type:complete len:175 (+),score=37.80 TRINITY_DN7660_c0_g2_i3:309-833(+)
MAKESQKRVPSHVKPLNFRPVQEKGLQEIKRHADSSEDEADAEGKKTSDDLSSVYSLDEVDRGRDRSSSPIRLVVPVQDGLNISLVPQSDVSQGRNKGKSDRHAARERDLDASATSTHQTGKFQSPVGEMRTKLRKSRITYQDQRKTDTSPALMIGPAPEASDATTKARPRSGK